MTTRKNYNSIVFLTTLSVYLGLVLVGAPASQVLAQQNKIVSRQANTGDNKSEPQNRVEKDACSQLDGVEIIKLLAKYSIDLTPFDFSFQVDYLENKPANLRVILAQGDKTFVDAFRRTVACIPSKDKETQNQPAKEIERAKANNDFAATSTYSNFKANVQEIVVSNTLTFADDETAKSFADFNKSALEQAHKIEIEYPELAKENKLESAILKNTTFSLADNQVFIVTRLPRGSLDALIAKDAQ